MEIHFLFAEEGSYITDSLVRLDLRHYVALQLKRAGYTALFFEESGQNDPERMRFLSGSGRIDRPFGMMAGEERRECVPVIRAGDFYRVFSGKKHVLYELQEKQGIRMLLITAPLDAGYSWPLFADPSGIFQSELFPEIYDVFHRENTGSVYESLLSEHKEKYHMLKKNTEKGLRNRLLYEQIMDPLGGRLNEDRLDRSLEELLFSKEEERVLFQSFQYEKEIRQRYAGASEEQVKMVQKALEKLHIPSASPEPVLRQKILNQVRLWLFSDEGDEAILQMAAEFLFYGFSGPQFLRQKAQWEEGLRLYAELGDMQQQTVEGRKKTAGLEEKLQELRAEIQEDIRFISCLEREHPELLGELRQSVPGTELSLWGRELDERKWRIIRKFSRKEEETALLARIKSEQELLEEKLRQKKEQVKRKIRL